ncbi:MAG: glycosyltransferase family 4 protein [Lautropia sp.]|nr:glycosyltransferase family 4 protein [Lautropia sp.]
MKSTAPRLLSLNSYHYRRGGSEVVFLEHDALFRELGWETAVMSMHHPKNLPSPWSKYFIEELELGRTNGLADKVVKASKAIWSFETQRKLRELLAVFPADVAHLHCIYHHLSPSALPVLHEAGIPIVLTAHDLKIACPAYKMLNSEGVCERCRDGSVINVLKHRCIHKSVLASTIVMLESGLSRTMNTWKRYVNRVVAPSEFYRNKLIEWGWPAEQVVYVPNYVDANVFTPSYEPSDYILYAGRLSEEKGVPTLVKAAAKAGVKLRVAGTGPLEAELKALPNADSIEWLGYCSGDALWDQVRGARALVLPSEWYENAPMSVLEAFASGTPVVGADIGGIPEMITPETGWVFPSGDVDALAGVLTEVAGKPDAVIAEMGRHARERCATKFSRARYIEGIQTVYRELGVKF